MGRFSIQDEDGEDSDGDENELVHNDTLAIRQRPSVVEQHDCHQENPFLRHLPSNRNAEELQNEMGDSNVNYINGPIHPTQLRSFRNDIWPHPHHYHDDDVPVRRWSRHMFVICIIIVLQKYLPPPPPPNDTWHSYISNSTESVLSFGLSTLALAYYVARGCFLNIQSDVSFHIQTWKKHYKEYGLIHILFYNMEGTLKDHTSTCSFQSLDEHTIHRYLSKRIVGQHSSINIIAEAISSLAWQSSNKPLSLLLTGPTGVGKFKTLKLLSHIMLAKDGSLDSSILEGDISCWNYPSSPCQHAILELNGFDYALDSKDDPNVHQNIQKNSMVDRILHHIHQQQGKGALIIMKHIEQLSKSHRLELIRILQSSKITYQKKRKRSMIRTYEQMLGFTESLDMEDTEISLQNSIFLLTTDVGTKQIFDAIRAGLNHIDDIQNRIRQDLKNDLGSYFHMVDYVIPYGPLQYSHMKSALEMEIKNMNCTFQRKMGHDIQITDEALHFFASPSMVEYIEVPYTLSYSSSSSSSTTRTNTDSSFVFAAHGGHGLPLKVIQSLVDEMLDSVSFQSQDEFIRINVRSDQDTLVVEKCRVTDKSDENDDFCYDHIEFHMNNLVAT